MTHDVSATLALDIGNAALVATFAISLLFVIVYATVPWWTHASGRNVMALMVAITLVTGLGFLRTYFGNSDWFLWIRVGVFTTVPIILAWRLWMLIRVQYLRRPPRRRYDDERDPLDKP